MKRILIILLLLLTSCSVKNIEIYFCPMDDCQGEVLKELSVAKESIYFMTYSFTDDKLAEILVEKNSYLDVEGVIEKQRITSKYNVFRMLNASGVKVIPDRNRALMHNKVFIIDEKTVVTGSYNPTKNGNENNDENVVIIHDEKIAKKYLKEYVRIAYDYSPLSA